jgi:hypothetical protein
MKVIVGWELPTEFPGLENRLAAAARDLDGDIRSSEIGPLLKILDELSKPIEFCNVSPTELYKKISKADHLLREVHEEDDDEDKDADEVVSLEIMTSLMPAALLVLRGEAKLDHIVVCTNADYDSDYDDGRYTISSVYLGKTVARGEFSECHDTRKFIANILETVEYLKKVEVNMTDEPSVFVTGDHESGTIADD